MKTIVVGGGIAGLRIAKKLNATLITDRDEFVFIPLLTELMNRDEDITISCKKAHAKTIIAKVTKIDTKNSVVVADKEYLYDELILCTGAKALLPVPGAKTYTLPFYTMQDANKIKSKLPTKDIVIIGAGPTGVELAMELAQHGNVTLIQGDTSIVPAFPKAQKYAKKQLENAGVNIILNEPVQRITPRKVVTSQNFAYDLCIWTAGVQANILPGLPADKGFLVNECLQVQGFENIFAAGDCARSGSPLTAQAALEEANKVITNIKRSRAKKPLIPYEYKEKGLILGLGTRAHIQFPILSIRGVLAGWLRKAYYRHVIRSYT